MAALWFWHLDQGEISREGCLIRIVCDHGYWNAQITPHENGQIGPKFRIAPFAFSTVVFDWVVHKCKTLTLAEAHWFAIRPTFDSTANS
jgi:hypothetical protein